MSLKVSKSEEYLKAGFSVESKANRRCLGFVLPR